ncbi:putative serine/threonine-protein kinase iks1 [Nowakowskiella sp. JEL0407]|nr:putative serine/threonine-protein kinase iks1 [Nowakowskiella sp. JEL0407]
MAQEESEWRVILRNDSKKVVLYNNQPGKLVLKDLDNSNVCSLCKRPWVTNNVHDFSHSDLFTSSDYFGLIGLPPESSPEISDISSSPPPTNPPQLSSKAFNQGYYDRFFIESRKLGRGYRGSVFLCQHILDQVVLGEYAIKKVVVGNDHSWLVRMLREVKLLERLRHVNIIEYKHAWLEYHQMTLFGPEVPCLFILMERANGGNLEEFIEIQWSPESMLPPDMSPSTAGAARKRYLLNQKKKRLNASSSNSSNSTSVYGSLEIENALRYGGIAMNLSGEKRVKYLTTREIVCLFLDVCRGLEHLHHHGIIHRDLKPPNLLLQYSNSSRNDDIPTVLISDFGECETVSGNQDYHRRRTGATGTMEFMPPELLVSDEEGNFKNDYSTAADIWSLGMVLYYLCYSSLPYSQVDDVDILREEILNFQCPTIFPDDAIESTRIPPIFKQLIPRLLDRDATRRPTIVEVLEIFKDVDVEMKDRMDDGLKFSEV